jgi:hypothetical protein
MANRVTWDDRAIVKTLNSITPKMDAFIYATCQYHASGAQTYARKNAKWTDRTSNARNGLFGKALRDRAGGRYGIVVFGTVNYQPWLEVRFSGRYAIILPTIQDRGPKLMKTLEKGFATIFGAS